MITFEVIRNGKAHRVTRLARSYQNPPGVNRLLFASACCGRSFDATVWSLRFAGHSEVSVCRTCSRSDVEARVSRLRRYQR